MPVLVRTQLKPRKLYAAWHVYTKHTYDASNKFAYCFNKFQIMTIDDEDLIELSMKR